MSDSSESYIFRFLMRCLVVSLFCLFCNIFGCGDAFDFHILFQSKLWFVGMSAFLCL